MDRYAQMQLLMHRWLAQIGLVAPGGPSEDAKAGARLTKEGTLVLPLYFPFTFPLLSLYFPFTSFDCTDSNSARSALVSSDGISGATRPI